MRTTERLRRRVLLAAALLSLGAPAPASAETAVNRAVPIPLAVIGPALWDASPADGAGPVTLRDVAESNAKVSMAYGALMAMWIGHFEELGERFEAPLLLRYRGTVRSSCGVMPQGNAAYCPARNAIYFDEIFLAGMAKRIGSELGTDGDMAAVGVIAHEVGHAVATQLGYASRFTYDNEAVADCLAGAFARRSQYDGSLESGDLDEAFLGMALAGDPELATGDDAATHDRRQERAALMSHGTREQRMRNFGAGLQRGPGACLPAFVS